MKQQQQPVKAPVALGYSKAWAAGIAGTLGTAISQILIYGINQGTGHPLPADISAAVSTLVITGITVVAVYFTPHNYGSGNK